MAFPSGVEYIIPVTVNKSLVSGTLANFVYQVDLTSRYSTIANYINAGTRENTAVYDPATNTTCPSLTALQLLQAKKVVMYWDGPASSTTTKTFFICFGKSLNQSYSSSAFTNSGYTHHWGFNETTGTTIYPECGSRQGTSTANVTVGNSGIFGNSISNNGSGSGAVTFDNEIIGDGDRSFEFTIKLNSIVSSGYIFNNGRCSLDASSSSFYFTRNSTYVRSALNTLNLGNWQHLVITSTSAGITNFYLNGSLSGSANQNAGSPVIGTNNLKLLNGQSSSNPLNGLIDELGLTSTILSTDYITTRSNLILNSSFWTIENGIVITDNPSSGYSYRYGYSY